MSYALARHVIADLYGCEADLDDEAAVAAAASMAAEAAGARSLGLHTHRYQPQGVSVFVLLAESHLSIHTWPEHRYAAVEVFTCGRRTDPRAGLAVVEKALRPQRKEESERPRGIMALCRPQTPAAP